MNDKSVLVDFSGLYEQYSEDLKDTINDYHAQGYRVWIAVNYSWLKLKLNTEDYSMIDTWLNMKGVEFDQLLINFQTQTMYQDNPTWSLVSDVYLP